MAAKIQENNAALKRDIDNWQQKYREADNKAREMENHLFKNTQEKEKLSSMIKLKNNESGELRN